MKRKIHPKNQISSGDNWNFDKSIIINLDGNFTALPNGTKLILVDPNGNSDKYYTLTITINVIRQKYPTNFILSMVEWA